MKLVATQQEQDLAAMLRDLFATECPATQARTFADPGPRGHPESLWRALTDAGVLGLPFAEEHGGAGGSLDDLATVYTEAGRALCPTILSRTVHFGLAVDRLGSAEQRARYLGPLCAGQLRATLALWNPRDAAGFVPGLTAAPAGTGWRLSGTLDFVADADLADVLLVGARVKASTEPQRLIALVVATDTPGVHVEPVPTFSGDRVFRLRLDEAVVPGAEALTGGCTGLRPDDIRLLANTSVALHCLDMVGGAAEVLRRTVDHTTSRHQFGRPIASFQAAQHLVADMHIRLQAARLASRSAVFWLGRGHLANRETAIARIHAATAYKRITLDAHQLHGGMGYVLETDLHLWSERARVLATLDGTADVAGGWLEREVGLG